VKKFWVHRVFVIWLLLVFALIFAIFPIYWLVTMSLKTNVQITAWPPMVFSFKPTAENWNYVLVTGPPYLRYVLNSVVIVAFTTLITLSVGSMAAYSLSRFRFRGRYLFMFWILTARILPPVAIGIPFFLLMRRLGLVDSYLAVVLAHCSFIMPMGVWLMTSFFDQVPKELEEAVKVDGGSPLQAFLYVVVPVSSSGLAAAAILASIFSWNEFFYALVLTGMRTRTMTVAVAAFQGAISLQWGQMAAAATLTILPLVIMVSLAQRRLISGLTAGALK
jgi:multiple sugar transport system permease protein